MFTLLIACTANVCRSPLAAFTVGHILSEQLSRSARSRINVRSAGTRAWEGAAVCPLVATALSASDEGNDFNVQHVSRPVSTALIADADLIVVPDTENRTRIASASPLARHRTFTLREANTILASSPMEELPHLSALAPFMHVRRPAAPARTASRFGVVRGRRSEGILDISDGHTLGARRHRITVMEIRSQAEILAERLALCASVQLS